jgi:molybdopterin molybdotransferase
MLSVDEAFAAILAAVEISAPLPTALADTLGMTLADDIVSDIDSPPFDKSLMDGFAVRAADVAGGTVTLHVIDEVTAGKLPTKVVRQGEATRIMTGAPIPDGADAVVRIEETCFDAETEIVEISSASTTPESNLMRRGTSMRRGDRVLPAGRMLRPQELGALAELGVHTVNVRPRPTVAVLATGDELVPVDQTPGPGQIRNSNETMLIAQIRRAGAEPVPLGIAGDNRKELGERIAAGLQCDMLLLSGGVSAGKLDLVPSELEAAGVRQVFHKVHVKPGKPVWYGKLEMPAGPCRHVFGLPGNPVSSLVCFELFARTAIRQLMGVEPAVPQAVSARLAVAHIAHGDRPTYHPAHLELTDSGTVVRPVAWQGSADLRSTVEANAMILFPPGNHEYAAGDTAEVFCWDHLA